MRTYRYILGGLTIIFVAIALGVVVYGISKSHFYPSDIPFAAALLCIIYLVLQYLFLIKFGFYKDDNAEQYNKNIIVGVPLLIVLLLMAFLGFEYQRDIASNEGNDEKVKQLKGDSFIDFLDVFDYPQRIPIHLATKYLKIDHAILESDTLWSVNDIIFSDVIRGVVYKTRNAQGDERTTLATFYGAGKLVDKIEIGHSYQTSFGESTCSYEFDTQQMIVLKYRDIRRTGRYKEVVNETKSETYLIDNNTGILSMGSFGGKN